MKMIIFLLFLNVSSSRKKIFHFFRKNPLEIFCFFQIGYTLKLILEEEKKREKEWNNSIKFNYTNIINIDPNYKVNIDNDPKYDYVEYSFQYEIFPERIFFEWHKKVHPEGYGFIGHKNCPVCKDKIYVDGKFIMLPENNRNKN